MSAGGPVTSATTAPTIKLEEGWKQIYVDGIQKLQSIIQGGMQGTFTNDEFARLYTIVYQMCIQKQPNCHTPQLYERYVNSVRSYLETTSLPAIQAQQDEFLVKELVRRWEDHKVMKQWLFCFFMYLDRFYVKRHNKPPVAEVCVMEFKKVVFDKVQERLTTAILALVQKDRQGEQVDRDLLRQAIQIYVEMGQGALTTYEREFQGPYIEQTSQYYTKEAARWLGADSCPEYLRKAQARFTDERKRLADYLHSSSQPTLEETLNEALLIKHQAEILGKERTGCKVLLETHATDDLARMFSLYQAVPSSLDPIARMVRTHVQEVGNILIARVNNQKNHRTYIKDLIAIHEKYLALITDCFASHAVFHKALKEAFEHVVNKRTYQSSTAELLAQFSDKLLLKGGMKQDEKTLNITLDNVVRLFTYLTNKDIFNEFYRKMLSNRLLLGRSASTEAEKNMISKLKLRCGAQFTSKVEGMLNDMAQAADQHRSFKQWLDEKQLALSNIQFTAQTLTTGFWPSYPTDECKLPPHLNRCLDAFKMYYDSKTNNRRLRWVHNLGQVTLTGMFTKRKLDLVVSAVQASILLLFNENEVLSIEQIMTMTGIPADQIKLQLRTLVSGKAKILLKKPSDGYNIKHLMKVNRKFTSQLRVIRIPSAIHRTTTKDRNVAQKVVTEDRKHAIEANIVRIMKARKTLDHQNLIAEVSTQLMQFFPPDPRQIKKRIEDLIAREYLERDSEKSNVYHYLA